MRVHLPASPLKYKSPAQCAGLSWPGQDVSHLRFSNPFALNAVPPQTFATAMTYAKADASRERADMMIEPAACPPAIAPGGLPKPDTNRIASGQLYHFQICNDLFLLHLKSGIFLVRYRSC